MSELIFDIGMHVGADSLYYLRKGFRVVGVEARQDHCETARKAAETFEHEQFDIVERALAERTGQTISFWINDAKDDWGSIHRWAAEQGAKGTAREITVRTITLHDLLAEYGDPYYIKCDIEGADEVFVEQLLQTRIRPPYVSIEATRAEDLARLFAAGYSRFQLVNQLLNNDTKEPNPAREGIFTGTAFTQSMSGLFGRDLPDNKWVDFSTAMRALLEWYSLHELDTSLVAGWLDIHAALPNSQP